MAVSKLREWLFGTTVQIPRPRIDSYIGPKTKVKGNFLFLGGLQVDGKIKGHVHAHENSHSCLIISESALIDGEVRAPYVILKGKVIGDVYAYKHLEMGPKARVIGNVYYSVLEMARGAQVHGALIHTMPKSLAVGGSRDKVNYLTDAKAKAKEEAEETATAE